ncbi:MAG: hypothetical protein JNL32_09480 [Candidatus Kapabacteria bacterium]|nr:hypothetical protein [Candidatus Kapabacteria bacterium]
MTYSLLYNAFLCLALIIVHTVSAYSQNTIPVKQLYGSCIHTITANGDTLFGVQSAIDKPDNIFFSTNNGETWSVSSYYRSWAVIMYENGKTFEAYPTLCGLYHDGSELLLSTKMIYTGNGFIDPIKVFFAGGVGSRGYGSLSPLSGDHYSISYRDSILVSFHIKQPTDVIYFELEYYDLRKQDSLPRVFRRRTPNAEIQYNWQRYARIGTEFLLWGQRIKNTYTMEPPAFYLTQGDSLIEIPSQFKIERSFQPTESFIYHKGSLYLVMDGKVYRSPDTARTWKEVPLPDPKRRAETIAFCRDTMIVADARSYGCTIVSVNDDTPVNASQMQCTYNGSSLVLHGASGYATSVIIYDAYGREIATQPLAPIREQHIPVTLQSGVYVAYIREANGTTKSTLFLVQ